MIVSNVKRKGTSADRNRSPQRPIRLMLVLNSPSPHQVDLLNALSQRSDVDASVGYAYTHNPGRTWGTPTPVLKWTHMPTSTRDIVTGRLRRWVLSQKVDAWVVTSIYTSVTTHYVTRLLTKIAACWAYMAEPPRPHVGLKGFLRNRLVRSATRHAHGIIGTGEKASEIYSKFCGPSKDSTSVPYYINVNSFLRLPLPKQPSKTEKVRFVVSAQLIQRKGLDILLNACEFLPDDGWELDIYGDGPLRHSLATQALRSGKPIRFVGAVGYGDRLEVFRNRHCFVMSTRWDGWGMVVPEAMAAGLPIISTDQAISTHEFVKDGVNGFVGPAEDPQFLARSMRYFIEYPTQIPFFAAAARSSVTNYLPEIGAERLVTFMRRLHAIQELPTQ